MSLNNNIEKTLKIKNVLETKFINEGLTKSEKKLLDMVKGRLNEAPIDYSDVGGA